MSAGGTAITQLLNDYGGWPPRADFDDWPTSWKIYVDIHDSMHPHLRDNQDPQAFRDWMNNRLQDVNIDEVMGGVEDHFTKSDKKLHGFLACLTFLKNAYRWAAVPLLQAEKDRKSLEFPEQINKPLDKVCGLHGISTFTTYIPLVLTNMIYENGKPVRVRFSHVVDPPSVPVTQFEFYLPSALMDIDFEHVLQKAAKYLDATEEARKSRNEAKRLFSERKALFEDIQGSMTEIYKHFKLYRNYGYEHWDNFNRLFGAASTWFMEGYTTPSGAETIVQHFLDLFLHVPGKCYMYENKQYQLTKMASSIRKMLQELHVENPSERFDALTDDVADSNALWDIREKMLGSLHIWRLAHAKLIGKALITTSKPEMMPNGEETVGAFNERELKVRAKETAAAKSIKHEHN